MSTQAPISGRHALGCSDIFTSFASIMNNTTDFSLGDGKKRIALYAMGILGSLATIACLMAIVLVFVFKLYNYFAHRLALYQVLAALFYGTALALELVFIQHPESELEDTFGCAAISFFFLYFSWVKLMFTSWVVLHLLCFSVFYKNLQHLEKLFVCISMGFPLFFVWFPFIPLPTSNNTNSTSIAYGSAGAWCWIKNWNGDNPDDKFKPGIVEQFILWYGPALICSIVDSIAIIIITARLVCSQPSSEEATPLLPSGQRMKALKELLPLLVYPILFCILLIPPLVNRLIGAFIRDKPGIIVVSTMISGIFIPLQPFFAGLALVVHIAVLKCPKYKCFRKHHHTTQGTFSSEHPVNWEFIEDTSTKDGTEVFFPNESVLDESLLAQKVTQVKV